MSGIFGIDLLYNHKKKKYFNSAIKIDKNNGKLSNDIIKNKSNNIFIEKKNKNNDKNNNKNNNSELKSLDKLNDILGLMNQMIIKSY